MNQTNTPNHDPIIQIYDRLIRLAENARRGRQRQQRVGAETAVNQPDTAVNGRDPNHDK